MSKSRLRAIAAVAIATAVVVSFAAPALALPSATPDDGPYMVNGPRVDDIAQVGAATWLGGAFSEIQDAAGNNVDPAHGLAVLDASGVENTTIQHALPALNGSKVNVFDLSLAPNGVLYAAGTFSYACGSKICKNLIGIDPSTGTVVDTF